MGQSHHIVHGGNLCIREVGDILGHTTGSQSSDHVIIVHQLTSGQIQHTAGMDGSAMIVSINTDPAAPINKIADYAITGSVEEVIPKMIKYYKQNSK